MRQDKQACDPRPERGEANHRAVVRGERLGRVEERLHEGGRRRALRCRALVLVRQVGAAARERHADRAHLEPVDAPRELFEGLV